MSCTKPSELHFLLVPFMAPGHMIPMMDMAKLLAQHGVTITIVTTPVNARRFGEVLNRPIELGLPLRLVELRFPSVEVGLPEGCESIDALPSFDLVRNFSVGVGMLQELLEGCFHEQTPSPSCIISDKHVLWTADTAKRFEIPLIVFDGMSCFTQLCSHILHQTKVHESVAESEFFVVPGLPDRVEFTRAQLPGSFNPNNINLGDLRRKVREVELGAYGVVINSFEELENEYVNEYKKLKRNKVWCLGPLSLCNIEESEKAQRGNKAAIDEQECLKWLDSKEPASVVYACLGSLTRAAPAQLTVLALALEASKRPFIWVVRAADNMKEIDKWIEEERFEERTKGRGLVIRGWAPQVLILSHPAIGAFLTHCGWNSTLEGVAAGVPMITWPQFGEQFFNEKLVEQVLGVGVSVGAKGVVPWGEEESYGVKVKSEELKIAIEKVMGEGREGLERRKRSQLLGKIANGAIKEGGSSHLNVTLLIQDIMNHSNDKNSNSI